jgi:hypothetical protein
VANAVTFLRLAHSQTTRTLFSSQGTPVVFSQRSKKVEMQIGQGLKPFSVRTGDLVGLPSQAKIPLSPRSIRLLVGYESDTP